MPLAFDGLLIRLWGTSRAGGNEDQEPAAGADQGPQRIDGRGAAVEAGRLRTITHVVGILTNGTVFPQVGP